MQDARNRALELGDKARREFDLEAEAEVRRQRERRGKRQMKEQRTKVVDCRRRLASAPVFTTPSSSPRSLSLSLSHPVVSFVRAKLPTKTYANAQQRLGKTVLENEYENKPIARPRY